MIIIMVTMMMIVKEERRGEEKWGQEKRRKEQDGAQIPNPRRGKENTDKLATQCNFNNESNNQSEKGLAVSVFSYLSFSLAMFEIYLMSSAHLPSCLPTLSLRLTSIWRGYLQ